MTKLHEPASNSTTTLLLNADETAALLSYAALAKELEGLLHDDGVQVPPRLVQAPSGGGSLFVMSALDCHIAITKLITFTPANSGNRRATIQGDVVCQRLPRPQGPVLFKSCGWVSQDVPDPFYGQPDDFEHVLDIIEDGCEGVLMQVAAKE